MLLESSHWLILSGVSIVAGFIDAVVGGGGLLSIPALLSVGMPPHVALGTNKLAACFGSFTSAMTYFRQQFFTPALWYNTAIATFVGAVFGSFLVLAIDNYWLELILPLLIISVALYTLFSPNAIGCKNEISPSQPPNKIKQWLSGFFLGGYDGFAGPGIGAFWTLSASKLYSLPTLNCCGLARSMTLVSNVTALVVFMLQSDVMYDIGIAMGLFMMLGSFIGARFAIRFGSKVIKPIFISVVIVMSIHLAWSNWF
ncbi:sulfite exporter TauE/SafE family protein [Parashewanella tropica]|uniref:sulfite exporter TauE/SafE family protein n=1 Tax=Parashewanella tropica TaxID=2547970 RepID=UPI00105A4096|nr:TSUP family transporter [Parashewanella tropica]